jgi:hypothetical protein
MAVQTIAASGTKKLSVPLGGWFYLTSQSRDSPGHIVAGGYLALSVLKLVDKPLSARLLAGPPWMNQARKLSINRTRQMPIIFPMGMRRAACSLAKAFA